MFDKKEMEIPLVYTKNKIRTISETGKIDVTDDINPETNEAQYTRNDAVGLAQILGNYDTRKHPMREWILWMGINDKVRECSLKDETKLKLTLEEGVFLKNFVNDLDVKEVKLPMFVAKTYVMLKESFTEKT